ncbi:fatty acid desaturase [Pseudoroseicyclus tamaricis]|uniref:Fatty acid desaturase n=1 Tax=Pseudoroseicyclus tamaricis TaxID=2705421 RepID=A0A6B2JUX3_9RHOB|nr:fatty acid desaturase [Pseudoroseicyclus tamaricis]NDV00429.1 fatty acid desaturase [Pseudoroseicyclus tamaricis]
MTRKTDSAEWPTLGLLALTYALWAAGLFWLSTLSLWMAVPVTAWAIAQHASLQHEAIHGHPFRRRWLNEAVVFPALALVIPYRRFRDTHLAHHHDSMLTDPYDDPETNYFDGTAWERLPALGRGIYLFNNTLVGRLLIGPVIGTATFIANDLRAMRRGNRAVARAWAWHLPAAALALGVAMAAPMPLWAYLAAAYAGLSLLKIRTFLEHQAHEKVRARTVIIEDRGPLALLFLNNNLHVVHHMHPRVPWYRLPRLYRANPKRYLGINEHYRYDSYAEVFRRYLFARKDPVPHPIWRRG